MLWTAGGRLFRILGPQAEKARLPNWVRVWFTDTSPVSMVSQLKLIPSLGLKIRRSVPPYESMWPRKNFTLSFHGDCTQPTI